MLCLNFPAALPSLPCQGCPAGWLAGLAGWLASGRCCCAGMAPLLLLSAWERVPPCQRAQHTQQLCRVVKKTCARPAAGGAAAYPLLRRL